MNKNLYLKILFVPIVILLLTVTSISMYTIISLEKYKQEVIDKVSKDFIQKNKQIVYDKVHQAILDIEYGKKRNLQVLKDTIKTKVDSLTKLSHTVYIQNKDIKKKEDIKKGILNLIKSQNKINDDNYFFVLDIKTGRALVHNIKRLEGKILKEKKDINGVYTFKSKVKILKTKKSSYQELYFEKPKQPNKQFKKLVYFSKFEPYNWIIGTGKYLADNDKKIQKGLINKFNTTQKNLANYLFISKLHSIDGGKDFATILVMPNKPQLIGKKITDNVKDKKGNYYRKEYLKGLKEKGEIFTQYWYEKPNSKKYSKKQTYFYLYKPWNWIIGSGYYFDDLEDKIKYNAQIIDKQIQDKINNAVVVGLVSLLMAVLIFYIFAKNITFRIKDYIAKIDKQNKILEMQKKEAEQKDALLIQQSRQAAMGEMIGNIAHQWRQPLNALGLTIQKIKMYHDEDMLTNENLDKSVDKSKMLINKMSTTIDDFRDFFKTDKLKKEFNIKDTINEVINLIDASLKNHNIQIDTSSIDKDIILLGYKNELEQVLLNILNNAKDALVDNNICDKSDSTSCHQKPKIEIKVSEEKNNIYIEINDNAGGIPQDIINKIFEPYFTTKDQGKGTGIGLYMSTMIIENNMNGILSVENKNNGACFMIKLETV